MAHAVEAAIGTSRLWQSPAGRGPAMTPGLISIVVPTYNEARNVAMLHDGLAQALAGRSWELIVVDDDSPDGTADVVRGLGLQHDNVRCLQRVQERGLCSAVQWGVQAAHGDIVVVMDGDLQHDPALIPRMLEALQSGADIVSGSRFLAGRRAEGPVVGSPPAPVGLRQQADQSLARQAAHRSADRLFRHVAPAVSRIPYRACKPMDSRSSSTWSIKTGRP